MIELEDSVGNLFSSVLVTACGVVLCFEGESYIDQYSGWIVNHPGHD